MRKRNSLNQRSYLKKSNFRSNFQSYRYGHGILAKIHEIVKFGRKIQRTLQNVKVRM